MNEETILKSKVPYSQSGEKLLDYLSERFRYRTLDFWRDSIELGKVMVNGEKVSPDFVLQGGDWVAYLVVLREPPVDKNYKILHEEDAFLVVDKPGQLPSHADGNFIKNTLIYLVREKLSASGWKGEIHLVHRLDRETSGLMVLAKEKTAHLNLVRQFEDGLVEKEYLAAVKGQVSRDRFEVAGAIGRDPESQISIRQKVVKEGEPGSKTSATFFEKVRVYQSVSLVRCIPKTGRTNQIRVHLDSIGHPLVGDKLYGRTDEEYLAFIRHVKAGGSPDFKGIAEVPRHLLHAGKLSFKHPASGEKLTFESPIPQDMREYLDHQE